jgi:peptidoglycan/LPS O-acetylase OafA/YrhL
LGIAKHEHWADVYAALWPNLLHAQNYFHTPRIHTWSLAVEEHFYLVVAIVFWLLLRRRNGTNMLRWMPAGVTAVIAALAALRFFVFEQIGGEQMNLYATHLRFDGLLIGTLLAYLTHFESNRVAQIARRPLVSIIIGAALALPTLLLAPEANAWTVSIGLTAMYLGFALVLVGTLNLSRIPRCERLLKTRGAALVAQIGFFSYSIYLWHVDLAQTPLKKIAFRASNVPVSPGIRWLVLNVAYVCLASIAGYLLARLVELPSLALRDRLFPKRDKAPAAPAVVLPGELPSPAEDLTSAVPHSAPESAAAG